MWETLTTKLTTTLEKVDNVKEVFAYPKTKLTTFPCVFFKPLGMENTFETGQENMAIYRFMVVVIIGLAQTTEQNVFTTILPRTVDAIVNQFDADWNQGTIDGHRVTVRIDSPEPWEVSEEQDGLMAYAVLNVEARLLTDI